MGLKEILQEAKEAGAVEVTVNGITYKLNLETSFHSAVSEEKAEDLMSPLSVLEEYTDEEILYYSTPFFDELQARKTARSDQQKIDDQLKQELMN